MGGSGAVVEIGPARGTLSVHTARAGVAARVGHDLRIEATSWHGTISVDPDDLSAASGRVVVDARSLRVREGTGGVKPLSDGDRETIEKTMHGPLLQTDRHPEIVFEMTSVHAEASSGPTPAAVDGRLSLVGATHPLHLDVTVEGGSGGPLHAEGRGTVRQTEWGIKPYSGFLGTLRVADDVEVRFELHLA